MWKLNRCKHIIHRICTYTLQTHTHSRRAHCTQCTTPYTQRHRTLEIPIIIIIMCTIMHGLFDCMYRAARTHSVLSRVQCAHAHTNASTSKERSTGKRRQSVGNQRSRFESVFSKSCHRRRSTFHLLSKVEKRAFHLTRLTAVTLGLFQVLANFALVAYRHAFLEHPASFLQTCGFKLVWVSCFLAGSILSQLGRLSFSHLSNDQGWCFPQRENTQANPPPFSHFYRYFQWLQSGSRMEFFFWDSIRHGLLRSSNKDASPSLASKMLDPPVAVDIIFYSPCDIPDFHFESIFRLDSEKEEIKNQNDNVLQKSVESLTAGKRPCKMALTWFQCDVTCAPSKLPDKLIESHYLLNVVETTTTTLAVARAITT